MQSVFSQCFSSGNLLANNNLLGANSLAASNLLASNNVAASNLLASNAAANNLLAANLAGSCANGLPGSLLPYPALEGLSYGGVFSVSSGSSNAPNGLSLVAENLALEGPVAVTGSLPFLGTVAVDGAVPSAGQGAVAYNAGPGVALTSGGCGSGLAGLNNAGLGVNVGLAGLNNGLVGGLNNVGLNNGGLNANLLGLNKPCGCGL